MITSSNPDPQVQLGANWTDDWFMEFRNQTVKQLIFIRVLRATADNETNLILRLRAARNDEIPREMTSAIQTLNFKDTASIARTSTGIA